MFSPQVQADAVRARPRVRRTTPKQTQQTQQQERESSVSSVGRVVKDDGPQSRRAKLARKDDESSMDKDKKDESIVLTKTEKYSVSQLPALPDCLRNPGSIIGVADTRHRHALILNHASAWVWNYTDTHSLPHTYLFMLPQDEALSNNRDTPFPLGTLVSPSANSEEPGLVVVMPLTGRIAYWEAVGSAAAEGLFAKRRGVEGKVQLSFGETITSICSIEPAGFILCLSSGNLVHLALRDAAGRPGITTTPLKEAGFMSGILGKLRTNKQTAVVAVRAGRVGKMGEREIVVATARGVFSIWYVQRGGVYDTRPEVDLRDAMLRAVEKAAPSANHHIRENFTVLDIAIMTSDEAQGGDQLEADVELLVLTGYIGHEDRDTIYALVEVTLKQGGRSDIKAVHPITCYTEPVEISLVSRPRVYIPKPRNTAFVVFERAVVILSNLRPYDSSGRRAITDEDMDVDRQLLGEEEEQERKAIFEDVIDFKERTNISIVGSGGEDILFETFRPEGSFGQLSEEIMQKKIGNPGVILIARTAGVLRVEAFDAEEDRGKRPTGSPETMVKSKIEQAVFFGHIRQNPLNFAGRRETRYMMEDIEQAALEISTEILNTRSKYITPMLPSMEKHLELRGERLHNLMEHLSSTYPPLSPITRWKLLQDAEKCSAASAVWANYDERNSQDRGTEDVLSYAITNHLLPPSEVDDSDRVRTWFLHHINDVGELVQHIKRGLVAKSLRGRREALVLATADRDANQIVLACLHAAFNFRIRDGARYGFDGLMDDKGLLINSAGFPPPWTSPLTLLQALDDHYDFSIMILNALFGSEGTGKEVVDDIGAQAEDYAELLCRTFLERVRWMDQQGSSDLDARVKERYEKQRGSWIKALVPFGRHDAAYNVAERYQDFRTLVELAYKEITEVEAASIENLNEEDRLELSQRKADVLKRLKSYLDRFRAPFANQLYDYQIENGRFQELLEQFKEYEIYLTKFLRLSDKYAKYAKLTWIHEVSLQEYDRAGDTLFKVAFEQEDQLWNKKVELSIGKLCKLAALPDEQAEKALEVCQSWQGQALTLIQIQEELLTYLRTFLRGAIDQDAEVEITMKERGKIVSQRLATKNLFVKALNLLFNWKIIDPELLIDLLTLMDGDDEGSTYFPQFYYALKVLKEANLPSDRARISLRSIWRRCYLQDDWPTILDTKRKTDEELWDESRNTILYVTFKRAYKNGLFDGPDAVKFLLPEEALFPEDARADDLRIRFSQSDDAELETLILDFTQENKNLMRLMRKTKLSDFAASLPSMVRDDLKAQPVAREDIEMAL